MRKYITENLMRICLIASVMIIPILIWEYIRTFYLFIFFFGIFGFIMTVSRQEERGTGSVNVHKPGLEVRSAKVQRHYMSVLPTRLSALTIFVILILRTDTDSLTCASFFQHSHISVWMELNSGGETAVGSGVESLFVLHDCISLSQRWSRFHIEMC